MCYCVHSNNSEDVVNEIDKYWDAHYLSTGEAAWCIMGYTVAKKKPAVKPISVHESDNQSNCQYHQQDGS